MDTPFLPANRAHTERIAGPTQLGRLFAPATGLAARKTVLPPATAKVTLGPPTPRILRHSLGAGSSHHLLRSRIRLPPTRSMRPPPTH